MATIDHFFDAVDSDRQRRAKELNGLLALYAAVPAGSLQVSAARATVVLCYANWEGFFNECVEHFFEFCALKGILASQVSWNLLLGVFAPDFEMVFNRNNSRESQLKFLASMQGRLGSLTTDVNQNIVQARSNLDFAKVVENWSCLGIQPAVLNKHRNRIDKELVGWRHSVAHGDSPDLSKMDASKHVQFTSEVMLIVSDCFQERMLTLI